MYFVCFTCSLNALCTSSNNWKFWSLFRIISHLLYLSLSQHTSDNILKQSAADLEYDNVVWHCCARGQGSNVSARLSQAVSLMLQHQRRRVKRMLHAKSWLYGPQYIRTLFTRCWQIQQCFCGFENYLTWFYLKIFDSRDGENWFSLEC